ncbi:MAG: site-specific DNA-methyltransferase [Deltaproteobacteria bacterium]
MSDIEKADLKSLDIAEEKRKKLKELFPEVFIEKKIDFDKLKSVLGEIIETGRERYGMNWAGKSDCLRIIQQPSVGTLKPCREESVDFDDTENLFIEGDNLEVLKLLQKSYYGKIKMIYIDPPYNTGNDFIYPDNYSESLDTYLKYTGQVDSEGRKYSTNAEADGRFHTRWVNMMYPRLYLARNLVREDGVIFISIDDNEVANLRKICDEIFGEENFVGQIVWEKMYTTKNDASQISNCHEYALLYCKNSSCSEVLLLPRTEEMDARYKNPDNDPRGPWKPIPLYAKGERKRGRYAIKSPSGKEFWPEPNKHWLYIEEDTLKLIDENRIYFGKDGNSQPNIKRFLSEVQQGIKPKTLWKHNEVGSNDSAKREMKVLYEDQGIPFDFPKPTTLIKRMLQISTGNSKSEIILDFFAGSGTSVHAVFDLNKEDSGNRKFIMVQLPEPCEENSEAFKAGYKTIADIGKERIRRVIKKIKEEAHPELGTDPKKQDLGFKVLKLDKSNFKLWVGEKPEGEKAIQERLKLHIEHIDPRSSTEDIPYELLLKSGFELTTRIEKLDLAGKEVFSIEDGALLICLEEGLTKETIKAMAEKAPAMVICLDRCFNDNDQLKTNAVQIMKAKGVEFRTV